MAIAKVDLRGQLEPGGAGWDEARDAVTASMVAYGCVVVQHDGLDGDVRQAPLGRVMRELFEFPLETKQRNVCNDVPYGGYLGQLPGAPFESLSMDGVTNSDRITDFASLFWPQGNPTFCETSAGFAAKAIKLDQTVKKMVLEGLGVRSKQQALDWHHDRLRYSLRMSRYGSSQEHDLSLPVHQDYSLTTMAVHHELGGLEVLMKDGSWYAVPPERDTCTIVAGCLLSVVTNGRVLACVHRVKSPPSNCVRFSTLVGCMPPKGSTVRAMEELVDDSHPLLYRPCDPYEFVSFYFSEEGRKSEDALKAFCGVVKDEPAEA